jgi:hypothetical protein
VSRARVYLLGLIVGSVLVGAYEAIAFAQDFELSSVAALLWPITFLVLLILWVVEDSKAQPVVHRPFDFGFLLFLFWLPYLPFYLWRTRRGKGLLMLLGFAALYFLGYMAQWVIYAAS